MGAAPATVLRPLASSRRSFFVIYGVPNILGKHTDIQTLRGLRAVYIALLLVLFARGLALLRRWTGRTGWGRLQTLALLTGALGSSIIISLLLPGRLQPLLTVPFFLWLVWLARRIGRREVKPAPAG
jgi:hypothetical protein